MRVRDLVASLLLFACGVFVCSVSYMWLRYGEFWFQHWNWPEVVAGVVAVVLGVERFIAWFRWNIRQIQRMGRQPSRRQPRQRGLVLEPVVAALCTMVLVVALLAGGVVLHGRLAPTTVSSDVSLISVEWEAELPAQESGTVSGQYGSTRSFPSRDAGTTLGQLTQEERQ